MKTIRSLQKILSHGVKRLQSYTEKQIDSVEKRLHTGISNSGVFFSHMNRSLTAFNAGGHTRILPIAVE